ncbi:anion transporter [Lentisphaera araneosa HTCC2155]|uniref:Anion transporter n=1 Tax=Lentisphaera araneosa HTCC2155 TaxID=313628 RepID=A6DMC9_9BACT|nr:SLC13 family permease [Lentisphaera araneosa]EDM27119.1 anion transporter [Lentisphaera araneosa HTCC2155]
MQKTFSLIKKYSLILGPLLAGLTWLLLKQYSWSNDACWAGAIACLCAAWWVFEPIPIPVTSLIPLACFPSLGVMTHKDVALAYGHRLILLLLGGFILSRAMEKSGAHKKIASAIIELVGTSSKRRVILAFMLASASLSMWISNTATTLMLLPIAIAVLAKTKDRSLDIPLLLGLAYAASVGGIGTPIGTPPNVIFMSEYQSATSKEISFFSWMKIGVPAVIIAIPIMWFYLTRKLKGSLDFKFSTKEKWTIAQIRTLIVFSLTALAWMTRKEPFGGWSEWLNLPGAHDSSVALLAVIALFIIPNGMQKQEKLLDWEHARDIPWGMLILFSGGICIANAFKQTGLSVALGEQVTQLSSVPLFLSVLCICLAVTFLTELTSNTASTVLLMPVLASGALASGTDPLAFMLPAVFSASCAFMLPVATVPNAVVYGSGKFTIADMAKEGFYLNLIIAIVMSIYCFIIL